MGYYVTPERRGDLTEEDIKLCESLCRICKEPLGYARKFFYKRDSNWARDYFEYEHMPCALEKEENRRKALLRQMTKPGPKL